MPRARESTITARASSLTGSDHVVAILLNVVVLVVADVWPTWRALPFVTDEAVAAVALLNVAALAAIILNVLSLAVRRAWLARLTDAVGSAFGLGLMVLLWQSFPFFLSTTSSDWTLLARLGLVLGTLIFSVMLVIQLVLVLSATSHEAAQQ